MPLIGQTGSHYVKLCISCGVVKNVTEFLRRLRNNKDGTPCYYSYCRKCRSFMSLQWRLRNPEKNKNSNRKTKSKYRVTLRFSIVKRLASTRVSAKKGGHKPCIATVDEILSVYTTICQVCSRDVGSKIHLEHCRKTGIFRGFLCNDCNLTLGCCEDSPTTLRKLAEYLEQTTGRLQG